MNSNVATLNKLQTLVVIGNGMVGHHCVEQLIEREPAIAIACTSSAKSRCAYDRVHLSEYFSGRDAESLALSDASHQTPGVTLHLGVRCWKSTASVVRSSRKGVSATTNWSATGSTLYAAIEGAEGDSRWSIAPSKTSMPFEQRRQCPARRRGRRWPARSGSGQRAQAPGP
jgi:nitrite reductase (NADH) large subunit